MFILTYSHKEDGKVFVKKTQTKLATNGEEAKSILIPPVLFLKDNVKFIKLEEKL